MRVISLVPSLTETLIESGLEVVGRTRFCIHPEGVKNVPTVGGTKEVDWTRCEALRPDVVIMDKEENTIPMAESCPYPFFATHITSVQTVASELDGLGEFLKTDALQHLSKAWRQVSESELPEIESFDRLPGLIDRLGDWQKSYSRIEYMIWRDPWMAVGSNTFIASMLSHVGLASYLDLDERPYPEIDAGSLPRSDTFYLFSSEPFPFERYRDDLERQGFNGAIVDGEFFSWFGLRSLNLLKQYMLNR